jgi:periplasmic protein TonB
MRWSFWPVSITLHVGVGIAVLVVPLVAEVTPPHPAPLHTLLAATKTVPVPEIVIERVPALRVAPVLAPVVAPVGIAPAKDINPPVGPTVPGIPTTSDSIDPSMIGSGSGAPPVAPPTPTPPVQKPAPTLVRAGFQGIREPKRISGPTPEYPVIARTSKVQGTVILEAVIDEHGEVGRIKVLKSLPFLDQAAISAVQQWRYTPTLLNGFPVSVLMTITVNFTLQN